MFQEIVERITKELTVLAPSTIKIKDDFPDGNIIIVGAERFHCAEVLFQPIFTDKKSQRIPRHHFPDQHEVSRVHTQGVVRQCRVVKRHEHVPRDY